MIAAVLLVLVILNAFCTGGLLVRVRALETGRASRPRRKRVAYVEPDDEDLDGGGPDA